MNLRKFIGRDQSYAIREASKGEEGKYFKEMIIELEQRIEAMPKSYETDGRGDEAIATLHYFKNGSDWWITEKDAGSSDDEEQGVQVQAFGFACLNGDTDNAELGYISIAELIKYGVELDLYWTPKTIGAIKADL